MSDVAALLAQLANGSAQPSSDPALAAIRLARASLDALVLRMGEPIEARVVGQLAGGLTQLASGDEAFVLKLPSPLPTGIAVTIRAQPLPDGRPAVSVRLAAPLPAPAPTGGPTTPLPANLLAASPSVPAPAAATVPVSLPQPVEPAPVPISPLRPAPVLPARPVTVASPPAADSAPAAGPPATPAQGAARPVIATAQLSIPLGTAPLAVANPAVAPAALPAAALTARAPAAPEAIRPAAPSASAPAQAGGRPVVASALPSSTETVAAATTPVALPSAAEPARPGSAAPLLQPGVATVPRPPAGPAPQAPVASPSAPLNLADLGQVAARQDSMAPLLARLAGALAQGALPRPAVEAAVGLLARRIDLNRAPPAGTVLRDAVLASGVLADAAGSRPGVRDSLLQLRAGLLAVLGHDADATVPEARRAAMPLRGEPPRAAPAQAPASSGQALPELARNLLGHADAALSRLKLMQVASQPPESIRADAQPARPELRVEIPLLLGAETAMLHLQVERDARHRPTRRERAWRMRFAVHFSATGEIGAEVALFGRTANISVWAAEAETAEAIEAMLPELSPALARHGLDVGAVRVRRGVPAARPHHPGQLVDSAR